MQSDQEDEVEALKFQDKGMVSSRTFLNGARVEDVVVV